MLISTSASYSRVETDNRDPTLAIKSYRSSTHGTPTDTIAEMNIFKSICDNCPYIVKMRSVKFKIYWDKSVYVTKTYLHMNRHDSDLTRFIEKTCLSDRLEELESVFLQVARGLSYLHSLNITHGDVKCNNILVDYTLDCGNIVSDVRCYLCDFGASVPLADVTGYELQSVSCKPPEIYYSQKGRRIDGPKTDIWALGITILAYITGVTKRDDMYISNEIAWIYKYLKKGGNPLFFGPRRRLDQDALFDLTLFETGLGEGNLSDCIDVARVISPTVIPSGLVVSIEDMLQLKPSERLSSLDVYIERHHISRHATKLYPIQRSDDVEMWKPTVPTRMITRRRRAPMRHAAMTLNIYRSMLDKTCYIMSDMEGDATLFIYTHDLIDSCLIEGIELQPHEIYCFFLSCMNICSKMFGYGIPDLSKYKYTLTTGDIAVMEQRILECVNYIVYNPDVESYLQKILVKRTPIRSHMNLVYTYLDKDIYWGQVHYSDLVSLV